MSKFLSDTSLIELIPSSIRHDESIKAGSAGADPELDKINARIASLLLFSRLFEEENISENAHEVFQRIVSLGGYHALEESLVDCLAWQFHVDDYDIAKTYQEKRAMVKSSIQIHRKKGTKWAVKRAVEAAIQDTELKIKEWFEENYNLSGIGSPYHFKAELMFFGEEFLSDYILRAKRIIESNKSLRSHCDGITVAIGTQGQMKYGFCLAMANTVTISPELVTELAAETNHSRQVQAMHTESILSILPQEEQEQISKQTARQAKILIVYPHKEQ